MGKSGHGGCAVVRAVMMMVVVVGGGGWREPATPCCSAPCSAPDAATWASFGLLGGAYAATLADDHVTADLEPNNVGQVCETTARFSSRPKPTLLKSLRWLHVPKTGTSFGATIMHYACEKLDEDLYPHKEGKGFEYMRHFFLRYYKDEYCSGAVELHNAHGHVPLKPSCVKRGGIVSMFRDPRTRHYSGWRVHGKRGTPTHPANLTQYVRMYRGCQVKMMLGISCDMAARTTQKYWRPAKDKQIEMVVGMVKNLDVFAFVGLTDYWKESVCLFHAMYGKNITKHELDNVRPGVARILGNSTEVNPGIDLIPPSEDPYDWYLFKVVREVFVARLVQYGLRVPRGLLDQTT